MDKFVFQLEAQLAERQVEIQLDNQAREWLAERGYDSSFGARPLSRLIQEHIKKPLADHLLFGDLVAGGDVMVTVKGKNLELKTIPAKNTNSSKKRIEKV